MPSRPVKTPSCPYHATATEKMAVRLLGGFHAAQIAQTELLRESATDLEHQKLLWAQSRNQYKLAVKHIQQMPDCPTVLISRPNRKQ